MKCRGWDLSHPHSPVLFSVFDLDSYVFEKFLCFLPEPPQDRNPVDEQLKSSGAFFIPHEPDLRVLDFKVLGMFVRIEFSGETDGAHIYEIAGLPVGESERTAILSPFDNLN